MSNDGTELISEQVKNQIKQLLGELEVTKYSMEISPGSITGDNYLGIIAKVQVKGVKNNNPTTYSLIVKSAPRNDAFRQITSIPSLYEREIYLYQNVLPEFFNFQEEKGILNPFKSVPKCYKTSFEDGHETVIMKNMKEMGFHLKNRHIPLDLEHVLMVVREYGKLHALSFAMKDQKPERFEELANKAGECFMKGAQSGGLWKTIDKQEERVLLALDPVKDKIAYEKYKRLKDHFLENSIKLTGAGAAGKYAVITHGDSWTNNILFKYADPSNPNKPTELCFLDWQLSICGSPALDLSYFLFTCTDKDLRDRYYNHVLQEYHGSLSSFLREAGSDPDKLFPFEVLQEHMKQFSTFGLHMTVIVLFLLTSEGSEVPDVNNITNSDDAAEKFSFDSKNTDVYNKRVRDIIFDFVEYGYL